MKINGKKLYSFVKKASANGKISSMPIEFRKDSLYSKMRASDDTIMTETKLKNLVSDIDGTLYIKETIKFMKYLKDVDADVSLSKSESVLTLKTDDKDVNIMLGHDIVVSDVIYTKDLPVVPEWKSTFSIEQKDIKTILSTMTTFSAELINLSKENGMLNVYCGDKDVDNATLHIKTTDVTSEQSSTLFGAPLTTILYVIDNGATITMANNKPLKIVETSEDMEFTALVANRTDDE